MQEEPQLGRQDLDDVSHALAVAELVSKWVAHEFNELHLHVSGRETIALGAFFVVFEHHTSVALLTENNHKASAHALLRPMFEVLVRGLWVLHADGGQLDHFQQGRDTADPEQMLRVLMKRDPGRKEYYDNLLQAWVQSKETLHGYTHHKFQSLVRWAGEAEVHPHEVMNMLRFSARLAVEAAEGLIRVMEAHPGSGYEAEIGDRVPRLKKRAASFHAVLEELEQRVQAAREAA